MTHQTNLFNTDPQVAGFKLDYMEVWNWGTFNDKVYRMSPHGNNSLLTGANASGKSTLIDALLALLVPLQNKRFYNQSSGAEKKGNRTDITYFFGNYGQQQEGEAGATSLKLRDKNARSTTSSHSLTTCHAVLIHTFHLVERTVVPTNSQIGMVRRRLGWEHRQGGKDCQCKPALKGDWIEKTVPITL